MYEADGIAIKYEGTTVGHACSALGAQALVRLLNLADRLEPLVADILDSACVEQMTERTMLGASQLAQLRKALSGRP